MAAPLRRVVGWGCGVEAAAPQASGGGEAASGFGSRSSASTARGGGAEEKWEEGEGGALAVGTPTRNRVIGWEKRWVIPIVFCAQKNAEMNFKVPNGVGEHKIKSDDTMVIVCLIFQILPPSHNVVRIDFLKS